VTVEDVEPPQQYKKATPRKPIGDSVDDDLIDEPTPKKARKPTAHTLMIDALVAAMGYTNDTVTCWGQYQTASKKLRKANVTPEEVPALYAFSRKLERGGNYKFKSPVQLAKDLPEYRKEQRQAQQQQAQAQDEQKPLDASDIVEYGVDYE
jgi:hypothetical protein